MCRDLLIFPGGGDGGEEGGGAFFVSSEATMAKLYTVSTTICRSDSKVEQAHLYRS